MAEITRIYGSRTSAESAVNALRAAGFTDDVVKLAPYAAYHSHWMVGVRAPFGTGQAATTILDEHHPVAALTSGDRSPDVDTIARLSAWKSPGAISQLSGYQSPGAISGLSGYKSPGAVSRLSAHTAPGVISRLSAWKSPGAITRLSSTPAIGAVGRLSNGWYFSNLLGLPLLVSRE
jgi:hypothetical protein